MSLSKKIHLREGERVIRITRHYSLTDWWKYFFGLIFLVVFSFFMFQLFFYGWWGYVIYGIGVIIGFYIIFHTWFFYHVTSFVITSERIIDIHRSGWFDEVLSAISYKDVSDVVVRKKGVLSSIFNYGNLIIQTKSQQFILEVSKIKQPQELQAMLLEISEQYQRERKLLDAQTIYRSFLSIIPDLTDEQLKNTRQMIDEQFVEEEE
jgi:hypothetical protein